MKHTLFYTLIGILTLSFSCNECCDCVPKDGQGTDVIIDSELYKNGPSDQLTIIDAKIIGDSIFIEFGSSGCDGSTWEFSLVDADVIMESYPEQRNIRLSLKKQRVMRSLLY